jgi:Xaa-Pro aminopeptidase
MNHNSDASRRKGEADIEQIRVVQRATEAAMTAVIFYLRTTKNPTAEAAHEIIDTVLAQHDCESPEGHIVAGGKASAEPHEHGSGVLLQGESIVIDIYPRSKTTGWFADMTRTTCIGEPTPELTRMYETVRRAQEVAIQMIAPGVFCLDIQNAVENVFAEAGYETTGKGKEFAFNEGFVHGVGHGVGKNIHEAPRIGRGTADVLAVDDVITIEPGLYYHAIGGVRLEDLIVVTETGCMNLTHFVKELR